MVESDSETVIQKTVNKVAKAANKKLKGAMETQKPIDQYVQTNESDSVTSISMLLMGLDYIFYIWTILLVALVTYLSIKKFFQLRKNKQQLQKKMQQQMQPNNISPNKHETSGSEISQSMSRLSLDLIFRFLMIVYNIVKLVITYCLPRDSNFLLRLLLGISNNQVSFVWLNNCLKWFYFNSETTKRINNDILKKLNNAALMTNVCYRGSIKRSSLILDQKPGDIYFKSVDTMPPKFTNIQTVLSATDSLTLKAYLDFSSIEMKAELKKSQRQLDIKVLNASAQVLIILTQSKNHLFSLECSLDPDSDCIINIKQDPEIDEILVEHLKNLFKEAAKQTIVNLELNLLSKKISNSRSISTQLNMNTPTISSQPSNQRSSITICNNSNKTEMNVNSVVPNNNYDEYEASPTPELKEQSSAAINEKRLLVKLIKATNLSNCEEPYCVVELDYPMQKHITDIQGDISTIDEQFLFDVVANSEELTFSIFDRAKDYGNDLIGEAVLPVTDLCSSLNSKRVIQLHRYGHTKTGSITAEFIFIEPESNQESEEAMHESLANPRASQQRNLLYQEDMMVNQRLLNPELLSNGSYSSPTPASFNNSTQSAPFSTNPDGTQRATSTGRHINRNYLHIQANNYNNNQNAHTLSGGLQSNFRGRLGTSQNDINAFGAHTEPKRTRSISRSVRNLFSNNKSLKRDKSYDSESVYNTNNVNYDVNSEDSSSGQFIKPLKRMSRSVRNLFHEKTSDEDSLQNQSISSETGGLKKSKSIGRSIKKLFTIGKNNNRGTVVEATSKPSRTESVGPGGRFTTTLTPQRQYLYDSSQNVNKDPNEQKRSTSLVKRDYIAP